MKLQQASIPVATAQKTQSQENRFHAPYSLHRILVLTAIFALATSLLYFSRFHDFYTQDSHTYITPASNLIAGHGFTDSQGYPETIRTPGYPLLLAPFLRADLDVKYAILFQHLLRLLVVLATLVFAFRVSKNLRLAALAGMLLCVDLPLLDAANSIMTEMLFTTVFLVVLWLLWKTSLQPDRWTLVIAAGLLSGASALVRPIAMFFFVPASLYLVLISRRYRLRGLLSFTLAFACLLSIWALRNYYQTGYFTVSTVSGFDILSWRAAGVLAFHDKGDFRINFENRQRELELQACDEIKHFKGTDCSQLSATQKGEYFLPIGRRILLQNKIPYVILALRGAANMLLGGGADRLEKMTGLSLSLSRKLMLFYTAPCLCLALIGLWGLWRTEKPFAYLSFIVIGYFVVISAGVEAYSRYRVPIEPLYAVLIAAGVDYVWHAFWRGRDISQLQQKAQPLNR